MPTKPKTFTTPSAETKKRRSKKENPVAGEKAVRAPGPPIISLHDVVANFQNLADDEKEAAKDLLVSLGIKIPGIAE